MQRRSFKVVPTELKALKPRVVISMDLSHSRELSPRGTKHLLVIHDQFSALLAKVPLVKKSDAVESINQFITTCEKSCGVGIAVVQVSP